MDTKKLKKIKFVCLKHLEFSVLLNRMNYSIDSDINKIPFYKAVVNNKNVSLNIFQEDGKIDIKKIKWVKITVPSSVLKTIDIAKYTYNDKKIKKVKPESTLSPESSTNIGLIIPIKIFNIILSDTTENGSKAGTLASILRLSFGADSIKLLDKDKKFIAYALQDVENI